MKTIEYDLATPATALEALAEAMKAGDKVTVIPVDPYRELRKAQEEGKKLQIRYTRDGKWMDAKVYLSFDLPVENYRIKSDTVKMWQWVIRTEPGTVRPTAYFYTDETAVRKVLRETTVILQRAEWTEISVEVEQ